jgi:hypothetical protein
LRKIDTGASAWPARRAGVKAQLTLSSAADSPILVPCASTTWSL